MDLLILNGHSSLVVKVSNRTWHVINSNPVPLKTRRVGEECALNRSRARATSHWSGVVVMRVGCQVACRPRHLTMVQNYEIRHQKRSCSLTVRR
ncbi:uncharacterized protein TNCV_180771 [Trichonephila clavipes]|nr:uncharacterized protein TNCV_180771 [Trichonephila clavipes]